MLPSDNYKHCYKVEVTLDFNNIVKVEEIYGFNYNHALTRNGLNTVINSGFAGKVKLLETIF